MKTRQVNHATLHPKEKIEKLTAFLESSGFRVLSLVKNAFLQTTDFCVEDEEGKHLIIHAIVKNISSAGWSWKPFVKRIQIKTYASINLPHQTKEEIVLLGGFALVDGKYVYAAWNIFAYMTQNTVRSCYIDADNLIAAHDRGFLETRYADNRVWLSDQIHMKDLIEAFIRQNAVTKIR